MEFFCWNVATPNQHTLNSPRTSTGVWGPATTYPLGRHQPWYQRRWLKENSGNNWSTFIIFKNCWWQTLSVAKCHWVSTSISHWRHYQCHQTTTWLRCYISKLWYHLWLQQHGTCIPRWSRLPQWIQGTQPSKSPYIFSENEPEPRRNGPVLTIVQICQNFHDLSSRRWVRSAFLSPIGKLSPFNRLLLKWVGHNLPPCYKLTTTPLKALSTAPLSHEK